MGKKRKAKAAAIAAATITPAAAKERQTDSPQSAMLHREFAEHPSKGLTPARLAAIFIEAEQGNLIAQAELFMDMKEKDTHIAAEMGKREMAVKKLDWELRPPRDATASEKKNTKILQDLITDELDIGNLRMDALDAIGHGYSCIELGWGRTSQGLWFPNQVEHRPPTWFTCPPDQRNTLHLRDSSTSYGVPLQPFGWIPHFHKSRAGYIARTGLFRALVWPYLYKNYSVRDLAEFLEIYGLPIRIGKYPAGAGEPEKRDLLRSVLSIGHNAAGIIPDSMQLELQQVMASGNADSFMAMVNWCEASQSKAILGGTLTSSTGANGNRSLGDVHNEVRLDIRDDDATQLDQTLSSYLVYPMAMLNGLFADNRCPSWVSDTQEPDDLALFADALPKLAAAGAKIPVSYVNKKLKIPEPEDGEEILGAGLQSSSSPGTHAAQTPANQAGAALAGVVTNTLESTDGKESGMVVAATSQSGQVDNPAQLGDSIDSLTELLAAAATSEIKTMVDVIRAKANQTESLEALRDDLLNSYGHLDSSKLTAVMELGFLAADLSGRFDVEHEHENQE
jgi:phage gp29-like protein